MTIAERLLAWAAFAVAFTVADAARASDEDLESLLQQSVVSTASKTSEVANDAPATMSVLTDADIRRYGIRSLDEAIDFLGMGLVTQNPLHAVEIGGRGVRLAISTIRGAPSAIATSRSTRASTT